MQRTWKLGTLTGSELDWRRDGRFAKQTFRNSPSCGHSALPCAAPNLAGSFTAFFARSRQSDGKKAQPRIRPGATTAAGKGAIFTFTVEGAHAHDIAQVMDRYGVAVRAGLHCAEPLSRRFGITSSARASFALYNTLEDADAFADALIKAREFFA